MITYHPDSLRTRRNVRGVFVSLQLPLLLFLAGCAGSGTSGSSTGSEVRSRPVSDAPSTGGASASASPHADAPETLPTGDALLVCATDAECGTIDDGCCGCTSGGGNKPIALKYRAAAEKARRAECADTACLAVMSADPLCFGKPACMEGRCTIRPGKGP